MNLNLFFTPTDILLPAHADMRRWSVIACDQFTADAGYWQAVQDTVCDAPSTLRLMLPEFYLGKCDEAAATREIQQTMRRYLDDGVFRTVPHSLVLVQRMTDDIINPLIKLITGGNGTDVAGLTIPVAGTENGIDFGAFISAIINFLIVAWVVFMIVKAFNKMKDGTAKLPFMKNAKGEEVIEHAPTCPFCLEEINVGATRCPHCTAELPAPAEVTIEVVRK